MRAIFTGRGRSGGAVRGRPYRGGAVRRGQAVAARRSVVEVVETHVPPFADELPGGVELDADLDPVLDPALEGQFRSGREHRVIRSAGIAGPRRAEVGRGLAAGALA